MATLVTGTSAFGTNHVHVAYVKSGTSHKLYLNGVLELSTTFDLSTLLPAAMLVYAQILTDSTGLPIQSSFTGVKIWEVALSLQEVQRELECGQRVARTADLYSQAMFKDPNDLIDWTRQGHDWAMDVNKPGVLVPVKGPRGVMPRFPHDAPLWAGYDTGLAAFLDEQTAIGSTVALAVTSNLPNIDSFTFMGWFRVPTAAPRTNVPLFRIANSAADDVFGGLPELRVQVTTTGFIQALLGPAVSTRPLDVGPDRVATAPIPSTVSFTPTTNFSPAFTITSYLWELVDGPSQTSATVLTPTALNTGIRFDNYFAGSYTFRLTVSGTTAGVTGTLKYTDYVTIVVPERVTPRIASGNARIVFPTATVNLAPTITDDGWSGALTYLWEQVSGPDTATIVTPTAAVTDVTVIEDPGVYVFKLTVTSANFTGIGYWRVTVFTGIGQDTPDDFLDVVLTVGGVEYGALLGTLAINEAPNEISNTCSLTIFGGVTPDLFEEVIITQGSTRIFLGVINRYSQHSEDGEANIKYQINAIGPEWHFMRRRVTQRYTDMSASDIGRELVAMVPGFTDTGIPDGLPTIPDISFFRDTVGEALTKIANAVSGHWTASYLKVITLSTVATADLDPAPLTAEHPSLRNLTIERDGSQVANRVIFEGGGSNAAADVAVGADAIPVQNLEFYNEAGGKVRTGAQELIYTGVKTVPKPAVTSGSSGGTDPNSQQTVDLTPVIVYSAPTVGPGITQGYYQYYITATFPEGETSWLWTWTWAWGFSGAAEAVWMQPGEFPDRAVRLNVYRSVAQPVDGVFPPTPDAAWYIGSMAINSWILDYFGDNLLVNRQRMPTTGVNDVGTASSTNSGPTDDFFLVGVSGIVNPIVNGDSVNIVVTADDADSQTEIAALLGGTDDGVIEIFLQDGRYSEATCVLAAEAYLAGHASLDIGVSYDSNDQRTHPGQVISVDLPSPTDLIGDFKVQSVDIDGFENNVAPVYKAKASFVHAMLETLLARIGQAVQFTGQAPSSGGSSSSGGGLSTSSSARRSTLKTFGQTNWDAFNSGRSALDVGWVHTDVQGSTFTGVLDTLGSWSRSATGATAGNLAEMDWHNATKWAYIDWSPYFECVIRTGADITNMRWYIGMFAASPTSTDNLATKGVGLVYSTVRPDSGWTRWSSDGTQTVGSAGILPILPNTVYNIKITATKARTTVSIRNLTAAALGSVAFASPAISQIALRPHIFIATLNNAVKSFDLLHAYGEHS